MRICTLKATGRIIEAQSGGDGDHIADPVEREQYRARQLDTLRKNAAGLDVDVKFVSEEEARALLAAQAQADKTYADRRRAEYPPIGDQLDALWKGGAAEDEMRALVMAVKNKHPKPAA